MNRHQVVGFFNPISWGWDKISGWVDDEVSDAITGVLGWLVTWVLNGVAWIMQFVADIMQSDVLDPPDLSAEWFADGIYQTDLSAALGHGVDGLRARAERSSYKACFDASLEVGHGCAGQAFAVEFFDSPEDGWGTESGENARVEQEHQRQAAERSSRSASARTDSALASWVLR